MNHHHHQQQQRQNYLVALVFAMMMVLLTTTNSGVLSRPHHRNQQQHELAPVPTSLSDEEIAEALKDFVEGNAVLTRRLYDYHRAQQRDHRDVLRMLQRAMQDREGVHRSVARISHNLHKQSNHTLRHMHMLSRARREIDDLFDVINSRLYKTGGLPNVVAAAEAEKNRSAALLKHHAKKEWYDKHYQSLNKQHIRDFDSLSAAAGKVQRFFKVLNATANPNPLDPDNDAAQYASDTFQ